jgi:hypothetical protein
VAGCNVVSLLRDAEITRMVPGSNLGTGDLECTLVLEFGEPPAGVDPTDVRVVFESPALAGPVEFDWDYIARHDVRAQGTSFGSGYRKNEATTPHMGPPSDEPIQVKFPLGGRDRFQARGHPTLTARLLWGGESQHSASRTIEHVYQREDGRLF